MKGLAWAVALPLAVLGVIVLLTDWIDWPWWVGLALLGPGGLTAVWDLDRIESLFDDGGPTGDHGTGDGSNGGGGDGF